ncbi:MAG: peptidoglycan editing factor PgeF [Oscillospiraceae bacterium]
MTEYQVNGVTVLAADSFRAAGGVAHGFSTRLGGVSTGIYASLNLGSTRGDEPDRVRENYRRFCAAIGADVSRVVMTKQVHGTVIRTVAPADAKADLYDPAEYECDGLITDVPGLALTIFSADCIPVLLYDPVQKVIAAVHAGWRGTAGDIAGKAVRQMQTDYGCRPGDILAAIGPGISQCCFETHADVPEAMIAALGKLAKPHIISLENGKFKVGLKEINAALLQCAGVTPDHIEISRDCTACLPEKYWSHRVTRGDRGSQAAMLQLL